ncbi:MAG: ABC transporter substrate-binding protein, partial [Candidatus Rokuibacteriota bacterium]
LSAPTPNVAEVDGYGVFIIKASAGDVPELDGIIYTGIAVHNVYANRNPDVLRRWVRAVQKGYRLMRSDPATAATHMRKHVARDPAFLARIMPDLLPALSEDGRMSEPIMQKTLDFLFEIGQIPNKPSAKEGILWTNRYLGR